MSLQIGRLALRPPIDVIGGSLDAAINAITPVHYEVKCQGDAFLKAGRWDSVVVASCGKGVQEQHDDED